MGAKIAILIAESEDNGYNGVLALGAGMGSEDKENPLKVNYKPKIPVLFISNKTEIEKPLEYIAKVEDSIMRPFQFQSRPNRGGMSFGPGKLLPVIKLMLIANGVMFFVQYLSPSLHFRTQP